MQVLIGLGGNLGDPRRAFAEALAGLGRRARVALVSGLYASRAVGPPQPDYLNAAAVLEVAVPPRVVLSWWIELEAAAGRDRSGERWGPRTLDLDLLMVPELAWRGRALVLPHPRFHERAFALLPAAEIAPGWVHPLLGRTVAELAAAADPSAATPLGPWI